MLDWLDSLLISGLFEVAMVAALGLLLHLQLGLARVANFGVVGFWGIGMYAFGVLYVTVDWPFGEPWQFLACATAATVIAGVAGAFVGWLISDMDVDGVLLTTLGFATAVQILATTEDEITGGALGLAGLDFPYDIGGVRDNEMLWLAITVLVAGVILVYVRQVHRSPYGRLLIAIGANEPLARSLGKPTSRSKLWMFAVTAGGMGLLGAMNAVYAHYLDIGNIGVSVTLAAIVALVLGGTARVWGAVLGAVLTVGLFDILIRSYLPLPKDWYTQAIPVLREALFGLALILVLLFRPLGLLGDMRRDALMRKLHGR